MPRRPVRVFIARLMPATEHDRRCYSRTALWHHPGPRIALCPLCRALIPTEE